MSRIHKEHLQAGYIFGDPYNSEYLYLPAGEVGSIDPRCIFEQGPTKEDLTLDEACRIIESYAKNYVILDITKEEPSTCRRR